MVPSLLRVLQLGDHSSYAAAVACVDVGDQHSVAEVQILEIRMLLSGNAVATSPLTLAVQSSDTAETTSATTIHHAVGAGPVEHLNPTSVPAITLNPVTKSVLLGLTATFTVAASGSPAPTVQWQYSG